MALFWAGPPPKPGPAEPAVPKGDGPLELYQSTHHKNSLAPGSPQPITPVGSVIPTSTHSPYQSAGVSANPAFQLAKAPGGPHYHQSGWTGYRAQANTSTPGKNTTGVRGYRRGYRRTRTYYSYGDLLALLLGRTGRLIGHVF